MGEVDGRGADGGGVTIEEGIAYVGEVLRQRRESTAIAASIKADSATFDAEWCATLVDLSVRLDHLHQLEVAIEPVLAPPGACGSRSPSSRPGSSVSGR